MRYANLARCTVAMPPSPATSGLALTLDTGQGAILADLDTPFEVTIKPRNQRASLANAEIAIVSDVTGDVVAFAARAQGGTTARTIIAGDEVEFTITADGLQALSPDGYLSSKGQAHKLLAKLYRNVEAASILIVSDSTGVGSARWVYLMAQQLGARFPAYTVIYHAWDPSGLAAYDTGTAGTPTTIQTGTGTGNAGGPFVLDVWNFAASGQSTWFGLAARWPVAIVPTNPDWIVVNHGKNEGTFVAGAQIVWNTQMAALTESLMALFPTAGLSITLQCPTVDASTRVPTGDMAAKARSYEEFAMQRGYGVINVHDAFMATGNPGALMLPDGVHPNDATDVQAAGVYGNGVAAWVAQVMAHLQFDILAGAPRAQPPSSLATTDAQLLPNGSFAAFSGAVPDSWTATNCATSKDTRSGWFESTNGYAVRLQAQSAAASSISQFIPGFQQYKGKWVTLAIRVRVPSASAGGGANPGRVSLSDGTQSLNGGGMLTAVDGFMWRCVSMKVSTSASYLRVIIYADSGAQGSADVTVDAAHLVLGKDLPRLGGQGAVGPAGPTGPSSPTQVDHLSTFGTNPILTMVANNTNLGLTVANQGILMPIKPQRDMSITLLEWISENNSGNYDIGILDAAGTRLWSKGSTSWPASQTDQVETVSPAVALLTGVDYWIIFSGDNTSGQFRGAAGFQGLSRHLDGSYQLRTVSSVFPIPASVTIGATFSGKLVGVTLRES